MKKIISALLSIVMCCSLFIVNVSAEQDAKKISLLTDLGFIDKYEPDADTTREMMMNFLDILYGEGGYKRYFENKDKKQPVLYGQVLMILVDVTGYSAYMDAYGFDKDNTDSYLSAAIRAGITDKRAGNFTDTLKVKDYADMIYNALTETELVTVKHTGSGISYQTEKNKTLLNSVLKLSYTDGVVTGTNTTALGGSSAFGSRIAINGEWYIFAVDEDMMQYLGMPVRIYYDAENMEIKSIFINGKKAKVVSAEAEDIVAEETTIRRVTYYDGAKKRSMNISSEADFIFNRRLLEAFTAEDLYLPDCSYQFIDNDNDSQADVIIAEQYMSFMVNTVVERDSRIIDDDGKVYDLSDYFDNGYSIYNSNMKILTLDDIGQNNIISYQKSKDGEYTNFVVTTKKVSGKLEAVEKDWRYISVAGERYQCLEQFYGSTKNLENINAGSEVEIFLDVKDRVVTIKNIAGTVKPGYILKGYCDLNTNTAGLKLLQDDGEIRTIEFSNKVTVDGARVAVNELINCAALFNGSEAVQQLILYKTASDGRITSVDTAENKSEIGANDNPGFTMDYDSSQDTTVRAITLNGTTVLASKYLPTSDTRVFGVNIDDEDMCYVQSGTAVITSSSLKIKLYNVSEDYVPQYVVIDSGASIGAWVDWWEKSYVVDEVCSEYIEETDEVGYRIYYYDGDGNRLSSITRNTELRPPNGNALNGDSRYRQIYVKDIPRGAVVQFNDNETGITSFAIQSVPMQDNSEIIFEKSSTTGGNDYGISEYVFNGSSICSYGTVMKRISGGIVINSHLPTDVEAAKGGVYPMRKWNRTIPLAAADIVLFYDKKTDKLEKGTAAEIVEGDMIFMHRRAGTIMTTVVYR